jgi:hypothetical protein
VFTSPSSRPLSAKYGRTGSALDVNQKRPLAKSFRCQYYISSPSSSSSAVLAMAAPVLFTSTKWILAARGARARESCRLMYLPVGVKHMRRRQPIYCRQAPPPAFSHACMQIVVDAQGGVVWLLLCMCGELVSCLLSRSIILSARSLGDLRFN